LSGRIGRLAERYKWPQVSGIASYRFALDGGGRHLVTDAIAENSCSVLLEIGCFLNGSALQWLEASSALAVVGIDPWDLDAAASIRRYREASYAKAVFAAIADIDGFIASLERHGAFKSALANVAAYRDRYIPVRDKSPDVLPELQALGLVPDIVYIDATKHRDDLDAVHSLWPDATLCGDDWTWAPEQGFPMRRAVTAFAAENGFEVEAERATWMLRRRRSNRRRRP
jgi:hypothetical protein